MNFLRKQINSDTFNVKVLVIIYLLLVQYFFLKDAFSSHRFSNTEYIYEYIKLFSRVFVYIGLLLSLLYPLIVFFNDKEKFKSNFLLVFIGFLPSLYHIVLLALIVFVN